MSLEFDKILFNNSTKYKKKLGHSVVQIKINPLPFSKLFNNNRPFSFTKISAIQNKCRIVIERISIQFNVLII